MMKMKCVAVGVLVLVALLHPADAMFPVSDDLPGAKQQQQLLREEKYGFGGGPSGGRPTRRASTTAGKNGPKKAASWFGRKSGPKSSATNASAPRKKSSSVMDWIHSWGNKFRSSRRRSVVHKKVKVPYVQRKELADIRSRSRSSPVGSPTSTAQQTVSQTIAAKPTRRHSAGHISRYPGIPKHTLAVGYPKKEMYGAFKLYLKGMMCFLPAEQSRLRTLSWHLKDIYRANKDVTRIPSDTFFRELNRWCKHLGIDLYDGTKKKLRKMCMVHLGEIRIDGIEEQVRRLISLLSKCKEHWKEVRSFSVEKWDALTQKWQGQSGNDGELLICEFGKWSDDAAIKIQIALLYDLGGVFSPLDQQEEVKYVQKVCKFLYNAHKEFLS